MGSVNEREDKTDRRMKKLINDFIAHEYCGVTSNTYEFLIVTHCLFVHDFNNEIFYLKNFEFCPLKITRDVLQAAGAKVRTDGRTE